VYVLCAIFIVGVAGTILWRELQPPPKVPAAAVSAATPDIQSRIMVVGDVFWARSVQTKAQKSGLKYAYLTHGLSTANRAAYDAWIANFECPITTRDVPYQQQVDYLRFNCRPEYLPELAKWFTAVTLANNHMNNNGGLQGLTETRTNLERSGIQYTGSYDMSQTDDICEIIALPARVSGSKNSITMPVALCGYMYVVDVTPTDEQLAVMQAYAKVMPVIAMPHMGIEYRPTAESAKRSAYRRMIDNGADVVIGAHPHVIQNSENYKGRLIAYSVGNFLFDQQSLGREMTLGLGVSMQLTVPGGAATRVYRQVGPNCSAHKDSCLKQLQAKLTRRPSIQVSYDFSCYDEASGVPKLGDNTVCQTAKAAATIDQLGALSKQW
jgi:poly-gamma-glutamate synthesis protein (capsule biosynthesis protein)